MEEDTPSPSTTENLLIPAAAVIIILMVLFVFGVILLLCLRKVLINRGMDPEVWPACSCVSCNCCTPACLNLAESMDCDTPDTKVWLDNVCPTKEQCSQFWGKIFSCYCCYVISDACKGIQICPDCTACQCPTCQCPCDCECECTPPQCNEINCICFKISV